MAHSEEQLKAWMVAGLGGDAGAHGALLRALLPILNTFYRRRLGGVEAEVDDLVQDALIALHTRRSTYHSDRPFTAWLFAIAKNQLIDHIRRRRITVSIEDADAAMVCDSFEDAVSAAMDVERLLRMISPKQARAIRDTHVDGKSISEAAALSGLGESDIKISIHRGLKALSARVRELQNSTPGKRRNQLLAGASRASRCTSRLHEQFPEARMAQCETTLPSPMIPLRP